MTTPMRAMTPTLPVWDVGEENVGGKGEIVGGAAKSTAFHVMVGRERSVDVTGMRARLGAGHLTQGSSIFRGLSVHDNIRHVLQETGVPKLTHAHSVQELLEQFSLQSVEHTKGRALSGGERRRAELACDCTQRLEEPGGGPPDVLLVDEPFAGVDPIGVTVQLLRRLCEEAGMGILITDHNVNETLRIVVHNGGVVASGGPEDLYRDPYVKKYYLGDGFQRW